MSFQIPRFRCCVRSRRAACLISRRRLSTTVLGSSGRIYVQGEILRHHPQDPKLSIFKARSGDELFVLKRVSQSFYDLSLRLKAELSDSSRLRLHTDCNQEQCLLIYPYFKSALLSLIREDPELPETERRKILRSVGEAIQELHTKDWIHLDIKPDNILINWAYDNEDGNIVTHAVLGDFDIAFKSNGQPRQTPFAVGNVMWRSPEGQTGRGITKASDMFSFGLVCIYTLGGGSFLLLDEKNDIIPEQEILFQHFSYFGPASEGLLNLIDDEKWRIALKGTSGAADAAVKEEPGLRFQHWGAELGGDLLAMISSMVHPDPSTRLTIDQILLNEWWQKDL